MKNRYTLSKTLLLFSCLTTTLQAQTTQETYLTIEAQVIKYANNDCKGSLEIFTHDGLMPFTYSIDGGKTFHEKKVFENLCEGKYFIQAKDATGKLGLTFVQLIPNYVPELFSKEEQQAVRESYIKDLLLTRERVLDQWNLLREVDFQLSKYGQKYPPIITEQTSNETSLSYTFKVLKMNSYEKETMMMLYERQIYIFKEHLIELNYDHAEGTTKVLFKKDTPTEVINDFFKINGFIGLI
jgi:hypothetical protein